MGWADNVERAHGAFLAVWGTPATWQPQDGSAPSTITGIIKNPGMEEQFTPGTAAGTTVVRFWIDSNSLNPYPVQGDVITLNGVVYSVGLPDADIEGGVTLRLRRNA